MSSVEGGAAGKGDGSAGPPGTLGQGRLTGSPWLWAGRGHPGLLGRPGSSSPAWPLRPTPESCAAKVFHFVLMFALELQLLH